tara:strand:- start:2681 stop:3013 length:333 start_codon:yes stop_codon:yes gene_type:complete
MDWMNSKLNQLIVLGSLLATIAGVGWTGAELMGRLTAVENEVASISSTENSVDEIEKRFEAIDVTIKGLEKNVDELKDVDVAVAKIESEIESIQGSLSKLEKKSGNPLAQ